MGKPQSQIPTESQIPNPKGIGAALLAGLILAACTMEGGMREPPPRLEAPPSYLQGRAAYDGGRFDDAADLFARATEESAEYAPSFLWLGNCHLRLGEDRERPMTREEHAREAVRAFTQAVRLDPMMKDAYINRALAFVDLRQYRSAVADLTHVAGILDPQDRDVNLLLGNIYFEKYDGMEGPARERYERYFALGGDDAEARRRLERLRSIAGGDLLGPREPLPEPAPGTEPAPQAGPTPAPAPGVRDREQEAQDLMLQAVQSRVQGRRTEMMQTVERILRDYGDTNFVRRERDNIDRFLQDALRENP